MGSAIKSLGNAHQAATQFGHYIAGAEFLPDSKLESPKNFHTIDSHGDGNTRQRSSPPRERTRTTFLISCQLVAA